MSVASTKQVSTYLLQFTTACSSQARDNWLGTVAQCFKVVTMKLPYMQGLGTMKYAGFQINVTSVRGIARPE